MERKVSTRLDFMTVVSILVAIALNLPPLWAQEPSPLEPFKTLETQLAGIRLGSKVIEWGEDGNLKPNCLLNVYGMPDYIGQYLGEEDPEALLRRAKDLAILANFFFLSDEPVSESAVDIYALVLVTERRVEELKRPGPQPGTGSQTGIPQAIEEFKTIASKAAEIEQKAEIERKTAISRDLASSAFWAKLAAFNLRKYAESLETRLQRTAEELSRRGVAPTNAPARLVIFGAERVTAERPILHYLPPNDIAWAVPYIVLPPDYQLWFYKRQGVVLSFIIDPQMQVIGITVAGRRFEGAKTANGNPFRAIKLGDDWQRVLARYGMPDEIVPFDVQTLRPAGFITSNVILRYHRSSNVEFTIVNRKVCRIFIWLPGMVSFKQW